MRRHPSVRHLTHGRVTPCWRPSTAVTAACALVAGAGYSTAYLVLTRMAGLKAGRTVLAPGIGGSVGMGTVEVARELGASWT
ncbi:hypothetical protein [Streptomyces salinarius]|uniref:hypothetical protein n=1 Tax=Streptomyces salinarius TaxID=2762598 RepID=UPI0016459F15|nr:hypothetical protein [Streptomyces salinarius]